MAEQITFEEFLLKDQPEQITYIQERLHLSYYPQLDLDCSAEEARSGKRLIGFVMRYPQPIGKPLYYIHPIDLSSRKEFKRGVLFKNSTNGFSLMKRDIQNFNAAAEACRETVNRSASRQGELGKWMVSAEYIVPDEAEHPQRILMTNVRVMKDTQEQLQARIRDIFHQELGLDTKVDRLRRQLEELEQQRVKQQQALDQVKANLDAEQASLDRLQQRQRDENAALDCIQQRQQEENDRLVQTRKKAEALQAQVRKLAEHMGELGFELDLKALGLEPPLTEQSPDIQKASVPDLPALTARTQGMLFQKNRAYEEHIVREFLGAMFSNQIIILSGPPGTGKSSLPPAVAGCIGAECRMVSVQPSWTDNQDLLGFYDPTRERFVATPFLEILAEAREHPETIYLICLDEMNLVRVEYYFSEILSAMETERKELRLYSPRAYGLREKALKRQLAARIPQAEWDGPAPEAVERLVELKRYSATFPIPANVQFVGTLNMDESTRELSPKVLDRSFIIEINRVVRIPEPPLAREGLFQADCGPSWFTQMPSVLPEDELDAQMESLQTLLGQIEALAKNDPRKVSACLSRRGLAHVRTLLRRGLDWDDVFLGKILPTLKYTDLDLKKLTNLLGKWPAALEKSQKKLETVYDKELRELNYWG